MAHNQDGTTIEADILEKDYCPPLDPALFHAIKSDLDVTDPTSIATIRETLDALKLSAILEQTDDDQSTAFDPSGTTGANRLDESADSLNLDALSLTDASAITSVTDGSTQASELPKDYDEGIEELSDQEKVRILLDLCHDVTLFDVEFTLKKNHGSFRKTLDEVLSLALIKASGEDRRGIDGFFQAQQAPHKRKGKTKNKKGYSSEPESRDEHVAAPNVWQVKKNQVDFITKRVHLSEVLVHSAYAKAGGSLRTTILNLCKVDANGISGVTINDTVVQVNAVELGQDFPGLSTQQCLALTMLTHPFPLRAHELAEAVFAAPTTGTATPVRQSKLIPQYQRPQLEDDEDANIGTKHTTNLTHLSPQILAQAAIRHAQVREDMFSRANAAYRKSRSKPLMAGAAAYYGEESRKASAASRAYSSAVADAQVRGTATGSSIDLHGITVQDALRNAKQAVETWWNSGQAEWARGGKAMGGDGFTIITGAGTHSQGGRARIRPAVVKMLREGGWRIEEDSDRGQVIVRGRARVR